MLMTQFTFLSVQLSPLSAFKVSLLFSWTVCISLIALEKIHILNSFWRLGSQGQISHTWFSKRRKVPVINHFSKKINQLSPWVPPSPLHHIYFSSPPPIMPSRHQHNYKRERECTAAGANGEAMRPRLRRPRPLLRLLNCRRRSLLRGAIRRYLHLLLFFFFWFRSCVVVIAVVDLFIAFSAVRFVAWFDWLRVNRMVECVCFGCQLIGISVSELKFL